MHEPKVPENRAYTVTVILLVVLAAFSTAMKDLNRLKEMVSSAQQLTGQLRGTDLTMLNVESITSSESCPNNSSQQIKSSAESGFIEVAPARHIETESFEFNTIHEPEVGASIELVASKRPHRNMAHLAHAKSAPTQLKGELSAKRRDSYWPARVRYRTSDRVVTLDLPLTIINEIKTDHAGREVLPDFSLGLPVKIGRRQEHGKTDNVRREFIFRKFERPNYSSRRAS